MRAFSLYHVFRTFQRMHFQSVNWNLVKTLYHFQLNCLLDQNLLLTLQNINNHIIFLAFENITCQIKSYILTDWKLGYFRSLSKQLSHGCHLSGCFMFITSASYRCLSLIIWSKGWFISEISQPQQTDYLQKTQNTVLILSDFFIPLGWISWFLCDCYRAIMILKYFVAYVSFNFFLNEYRFGHRKQHFHILIPL